MFHWLGVHPKLNTWILRNHARSWGPKQFTLTAGLECFTMVKCNVCHLERRWHYYRVYQNKRLYTNINNTCSLFVDRKSEYRILSHDPLFPHMGCKYHMNSQIDAWFNYARNFVSNHSWQTFNLIPNPFRYSTRSLSTRQRNQPKTSYFFIISSNYRKRIPN